MLDRDLKALSEKAAFLKNKGNDVKDLLVERLSCWFYQFDYQRDIYDELKLIKEECLNRGVTQGSINELINNTLTSWLDIWSKKSLFEYFSDRGVQVGCLSKTSNTLTEGLEQFSDSVDVFWALNQVAQYVNNESSLVEIIYDPLASYNERQVDALLASLVAIDEFNFNDSVPVYIAYYCIIKKVSSDLEKLSESLKSETECTKEDRARCLINQPHTYSSLLENRGVKAKHSGVDFCDDYYYWYFFTVHYNRDHKWADDGDMDLRGHSNANFDESVELESGQCKKESDVPLTSSNHEPMNKESEPGPDTQSNTSSTSPQPSLFDGGVSTVDSGGGCSSD